MGMFGYMTDTETVEPLDTVDVESEGQSTQSEWSCMDNIYQLFAVRSHELKSMRVSLSSLKVRTWSLFSSTSSMTGYTNLVLTSSLFPGYAGPSVMSIFFF